MNFFNATLNAGDIAEIATISALAVTSVCLATALTITCLYKKICKKISGQNVSSDEFIAINNSDIYNKHVNGKTPLHESTFLLSRKTNRSNITTEKKIYFERNFRKYEEFGEIEDLGELVKETPIEIARPEKKCNLL
jgi:hypothetical protein